MPRRPSAVICDLGGTLLHTDPITKLITVDTTVLSVVEGLQFANRWQTILITTTNERSREPVSEFLSDLGIHFDRMYMRRIEDTSSEADFKRYTYDMFIAPRYNVKLVLEDDPSVAKMFRTLNVPCFLVDEWKSTGNHGFAPQIKRASGYGSLLPPPIKPERLL